jgi:hypothetical protein
VETLCLSLNKSIVKFIENCYSAINQNDENSLEADRKVSKNFTKFYLKILSMQIPNPDSILKNLTIIRRS